MSRIQRSTLGVPLRSTLGVRGAAAVAGSILVAGAFTSAGGVTVKHAARWDGSVWSAVGPLSHPYTLFYSIMQYGADIIASPRINFVSQMMQYLPGGSNAAWVQHLSDIGVKAFNGRMSIVENQLYAPAGNQTASGQLIPPGTVAKLARFVSAWSVLTTTPLPAGGNSICILIRKVGGLTMACGSDGTGGGGSYSGVGPFLMNGMPYGSGLYANSVSTCVGEYNGEVWVGGSDLGTNPSTSRPTAGLDCVLRLDSTLGWTKVGATGLQLGNRTNVVTDMIVFNGDMIVCGSFATAGGVSVNGVARWNGSAWSALGAGLGNVTGLGIFRGQLFAYGQFGGGIAIWNGSSWASIGGGLSGGSPSTLVTQAVVVP